jgi:tetraacyldisaccharide 4'-kinase
MKQTFPPWWLTRGWKSWALLDLSLAWRGIMAVRRWLYRNRLLHAQSLRVPVIVVGSIFVGGTGKTPVVLWLTGQLRAHGWHPGIVSRGYGSQGSGARMVSATDSPTDVGDEPLLLARATAVPVAVSRDRVAAARWLLQHHPEVDVIVSDDGLQHLRLARQVEIAVLDQRGVGNGWMLPAGPLREPPSRLQSCDAVVLRDLAPLARLATPQFALRMEGLTLRHAISGEMLSPAQFAQHYPRRLAAAGIGHPEQFFESLQAVGLPCNTLALPDHFAYAKSPFPGATEDGPDAIIVTEKDVLKTAHLNDARLWVAQVTVQIDAGLWQTVATKLAKKVPDGPKAP